MIARYYNLHRHATVFKALTGLRVAEFDQLVKDVKPLYVEAERTRHAFATTRSGTLKERERTVG